MKIFIVLGALNAFVAVALGAFGAHGLEGKLSEKMMNIYNTAVQYQMFHALGLILIGLSFERLSATGLIHWSGWLMFFGIIIFSGSLYVLSITNLTFLGAITPIGGLAFLSAWLLLIIAATKVL